jgi:hypothetical protein
MQSMHLFASMARKRNGAMELFFTLIHADEVAERAHGHSFFELKFL